MTALAKDRPTPQRAGNLVTDPLVAAVTIFAGSMYVLDAAGDATPATAAATTPVRAVARKRAVQADGDVVEGAVGVFCFDNSAAAAAIARTEIGAVCYAADDQTVKKTGTCAAGTVVDVDDSGVWVRVGA